jgi:hypothetical protein
MTPVTPAKTILYRAYRHPNPVRFHSPMFAVGIEFVLALTVGWSLNDIAISVSFYGRQATPA